jgi:hypothetical protein
MADSCTCAESSPADDMKALVLALQEQKFHGRIIVNFNQGRAQVERIESEFVISAKDYVARKLLKI